jgi:2-polyprenyl-3-methyl-5-hydroxy-6-metoxy-1,4-benzoquinol methylase
MNSPSTRSFFSAALNRVRLPNGAAPPRLLDIGCGSGTMLEEARALGYECEGIELCDHLAEVARQKGFLVHTRDAAELDVQERYDIVTAMDIIEHLPSPLDLLRAVHRSLKPGGEVVVYTPNHRGAVVVLAKLLAALGSDYAFRNIFGGNHLCFFDDRTLPAALQATGFRVRKLWRFPYDPRRPGMPVSLASLCVVRAVEELGRPFGAVFRMVAYAQKEANVSATQP